MLEARNGFSGLAGVCALSSWARALMMAPASMATRFISLLTGAAAFFFLTAFGFTRLASIYFMFFITEDLAIEDAGTLWLMVGLNVH